MNAAAGLRITVVVSAAFISLTACSSESAKTYQAPNPVTAAQATSKTPICVFNAQAGTGVTEKATKALTDAGFTISDRSGNLAENTYSANVVFYDEGATAAETATNEELGRKIADALPGGADTYVRPPSFTKCRGEFVAIMVAE